MPSTNKLRVSSASAALRSIYNKPHQPTTSAVPSVSTSNCASRGPQSCSPKSFSQAQPLVKQYSKSFSAQTAKMSTMKASHGHNEACCNIPPVVTSGYKAKGSYEEIDGKKTYVTGPAKEAKKGILIIMDIFGFFDQTVQGADILGSSDDHTKYAVFLPDAFDGEPLPISQYPPDTEEKQKAVGAFFEKNSPPSFAAKVPGIVKAAQEKYPNIESWGILGYCWGGKVVSLLTSSGDNIFKIGAECHPAMVDPNDAKGIKVPLILLASKEEPADTVKEFEDTLSVPKHVETFKDQIHGWMAARSDLSDPRVQEEYTRGYKTVLTFFANNWS